MLTLHTYGIPTVPGGGNIYTNTSYYAMGRVNFQKYLNGSTVEMGFLMGFISAPNGNLPLRQIRIYTDVQRADRFANSGLPTTGVNQLVPSITGQRLNVSTLDPGWAVFGHFPGS
jgi:hypothetical protein